MPSSGGGVANTGGTLVVERSLIDNNAANIGGADSGGLLNFDGGSVIVRNTTIAFNQALHRQERRLPLVGQALDNTALFEFVTLAHNTGGGLNYSSGDTLQLRGSIVANNIGGNCLTAPQSLGEQRGDQRRLPARAARRRQRGRGRRSRTAAATRTCSRSVPGSAAARPHPGRPVPADGSARHSRVRSARPATPARSRQARRRCDHVARAGLDHGGRDGRAARHGGVRTRPSTVYRNGASVAADERRRPRAQWAVSR